MNIGDRVDDFSAQNEQGEPTSLLQLLETGPVVLFFYPKAKTPL
ncbi:MAG: peroxiredoxin Q/BCP [Verrucomicrobiales bacterium]|jgi:peroxiredoxin Q/BCP